MSIYAYRTSTSEKVETWVIIFAVLTVIAALVCALVYGITLLSRSAGAAGCNTYSRVSGFKTEYVIAHFLDGGSCYVTLPSGKTVPQSQVKIFLTGGK